jgi:hypothetical protein
MSARSEYVEGLVRERASKIQMGKSTKDVDAELQRFANEPEGAVIEAAVPGFEWDIRRWDEEQTEWVKSRSGLLEPSADVFDALGLAPYDVSHVNGNLLTTAGIGRLVTLANAGTGNLISSTTARVGAGDGAGTAAIGDTDLSASAGSTHRWFQTCTVTTPNVLTFAAVFATADGNFAWNEFGIDIGTATVTSGNTVNAVLLNHKTSIAQGTKASGQTWSATATITISLRDRHAADQDGREGPEGPPRPAAGLRLGERGAAAADPGSQADLVEGRVRPGARAPDLDAQAGRDRVRVRRLRRAEVLRRP